MKCPDCNTEMVLDYPWTNEDGSFGGSVLECPKCKKTVSKKYVPEEAK